MTLVANKLAWTMGAVGALALVVLFSIISQPKTEPTLQTIGFDLVELATDEPGTARVPRSWAHISHDGLHASLGLAASPRAELLEGVVDGNRVTGLASRQDLRLDDVYVEVWASYQPVAGGFGVDKLTLPLDPDGFEPGQEKFGEPIYEYVAKPEEGGRYSFMYWAGPEASEQDRDEMLAIIRSLRFD